VNKLLIQIKEYWAIFLIVTAVVSFISATTVKAFIIKNEFDQVIKDVSEIKTYLLTALAAKGIIIDSTTAS